MESTLQLEEIQDAQQPRSASFRPRRLPQSTKHLPRPRRQLPQLLPGILEAARLLQDPNRISLDGLILRLLPQNVQQLETAVAARARTTAATLNTVDNRVRELALGDVLAKSLVLRILVALQVLVVVSDLEDDSQQVHEGHAVPAP